MTWKSLQPALISALGAIGIMMAGQTVLLAGEIEAVTAASDRAQATIQEAVIDKDGASLASVFTENGAVVAPSGQVVRGRITIRASATLLFLTLGGGHLELTRDNLSLIDNTAYETGRYSFRRTGPAQKDRVWTGSYTAIWLVEEDRWRIDRLIGLR